MGFHVLMIGWEAMRVLWGVDPSKLCRNRRDGAGLSLRLQSGDGGTRGGAKKFRGYSSETPRRQRPRLLVGVGGAVGVIDSWRSFLIGLDLRFDDAGTGGGQRSA